MSLILDALRKSDVERSRQQAPQVAANAAAGAPDRGRRWVPPVLALLLVNAALLGWLLLKPPAPPRDSGAPAARGAAASEPATPMPQAPTTTDRLFG